MNFVNTKINPADFPRLYPELFAAYQVLMRATLEEVGRRSKAITERFDGEVSAALQLFASTEAAARQVFSQATEEAANHCRLVAQAADAELNAALPGLLEEKDAAQSALRLARSEQFLANQSEALTTQECYRELGLHDQARAWFEQFQSNASVYMAEHDALLAPSEAHYQQQVAGAFATRNEKVAAAASLYQQACEPHALNLKRALRAAESTKLAALQEIPWRRGEAQEELQAWITGMKQERLQWIESFLQYGDDRELQQRFEVAVSQLSAG
ncbi:MAG: hypothetical protein WC028_28235 [Candidatus Obscuribacterales bacterium]